MAPQKSMTARARNFWFGAGLMVVAAAGVLWLLGGPSALFSTSGSRDTGPADGAGAQVGDGDGTDGTIEGGASAGKSGRTAVLFGRKREEMRGTGSISARVVRYRDQQPVAHARVSVSGTGFAGETVAVEAESDAHGVASLDAVPAGDALSVRVDVAGEPSLVVPGVEVRARRATDLGTLYLGAKAALTGRVVDETGAGIAGADVRAYRAQSSIVDLIGSFSDLFGSLDRDPEPLAKTRSDASGRFAIADMAPGGLMVRGAATGRRQAIVRVEMTANGPAGGEPTIVLDRGAVVAGRIVDVQDRGIAGARVALIAGSNDDPFAFIYGRVFAETDAKGAFRALVEANSGDVTAIAAAEGYPTTMTGGIRAGAEDVRIVLRAGSVLDVSVVEKAGGKAVAGAQVVVMVAEGKDAKPDGGALLVGTTDERGEHSFAAPPGTIQMLMVSHPRYPGGMVNAYTGSAGTPGGVEVEGDLGKTLAVGLPTRLVIRLDAGGTLVGRVTSPDGKPIEGASVRPLALGSLGSGGGISARSGPDGAYRLEGFVPSQQTMVLVRAPGWVQRSLDLIVRETAGANGEVAHDFVLDPSATVRGRVVDEQGNGVAGASVSIAAEGMGGGFASMLGISTTAVTAMDGTYALYDVNPSGEDDPLGYKWVTPDGQPPPKGPPQVRVAASADGYVRGRSEPFAVKAGSVVEASSVRLVRGASVSGKVLDPSGRPLAGARVQASADAEGGDDVADMFSPNRIRRVVTPASGGYEFGTLAKGSVTLTASADGFASSRRTVTIEGTTPVPDADVRLRAAFEVRGRVLDPDGNGVAGASVAVRGDLEGKEGDDAYVEPVSAKADAQGGFALKGLPAGRVSVHVTADGFVATNSTLDAGGPPSEIRLAKRAADAAKRLEEIQTEMTEIGTKFMAAKDDAEKKALQERILELLKEKRELEGGDEDDGPVPPAPPPVPEDDSTGR